MALLVDLSKVTMPAPRCYGGELVGGPAGAAKPAEAAFKAGDVVEVKLGGKWVKAKVERVFSSYGLVQLRRVGSNAAGGRYPQLSRWPDDLRPLANLDPEPANVYADWLEDHGQPEAARMLREAFPLPGG